ncbi:MAG: 2-succinyl-5-enolpyruvyl-6-hydroxy-3-cyclohexene-1-carboxylic-acid synthase, partial [Fidelibacterota bacterium]
HIYDLVEICAQKGIKKSILCPGSRCAPLLIGFGKHSKIKTFSVTDERSAGFVGLGLAQQSGEPVVLVCTSGTAALNFAPAVTEAFYQNVPLIVMTADRPSEWIDQWDGQTIHQEHMYEPHVKGSFVFDIENQSVTEEALNLAMTEAYGPVHLNIPIQEPFYPDGLDDVKFATEAQRTQRKIVKKKIDNEIWQELQSELNNTEKIMILGGQSEPNLELNEYLNQIDIPIVGDIISNLHPIKNVTKSADLVFKTDDKHLQPDLLITFGRSVISKNLKLYLRKFKPKMHWHIGLGMVGNPFQSLTKTIRVNPKYFFQEWLKREITFQNQDKYRSTLSEAQTKVDSELRSKLSDSDFNSFSAVWKVMEAMPNNSVLHLGNSMPVRIANFIGIKNHNVDVWSNRGTSGIDGTVSTAVGHALADPKRTHTLIAGDLSLFYDRNGLWLNHEFPKNLRIVVLNDGGGGIFNMIPGPSNLGRLTELFTTPHNRTAELTAKEFGLDYRSTSSVEALKASLKGFEGGILEIFTNMETNTKFLKLLKIGE